MAAQGTIRVRSRGTSVVLAAVIFAVAFLARLGPMVRGGGLTGFTNYDDGVNFGGSLGLVHGELPYRDFLWLHPPGIELALAPFAALSWLTGEPTAFVVGRLGWMVLGAVNALLIARFLRPAGWAGAVFGGLVYALFWPAIVAEQTVHLEAVATTCLLIALILLSSARTATRASVIILAGTLLGLAAAIKMWGVVPVLILAGWLWWQAGIRRAALFVAGAAASCAAICLPFFLAAPGAMWQMVVLNQFARRRGVGVDQRLIEITGLSPIAARGGRWVLLVGLVVLVLGVVLAWTMARARPAVLLLIGLVGLLLSTPTWFFHYTALTAPVIAVVAGAALQQALDLPALRRRRATRLIAPVGAGLALLALAAFVATASSGEPFPARQLRPALDSSPGCVTTDHVSALILTDMIGRNLDRGCPLLVDLGGYSHDRQAVSRRGNRAFQDFAIGYLRTGDRAVLARFTADEGWSRASYRIVQSWPAMAEAGRFSVRVPR
jgi:alpha-1,2-mannosyltransferase